MSTRRIRKAYLTAAMLLVAGTASAQWGISYNWAKELDDFGPATCVAVYGTNLYKGLGVEVKIYNRAGDYLWKFGAQSDGTDGFRSIADIAVDDENIYIADKGVTNLNHGIRIWTQAGGMIWGMSTYGTAHGQFDSPEGIAVDDNFIYVADTGNHRIEVYGKLGGYVRSWGSYGTLTEQFDTPRSVAVDDEYVYVADSGNGKIKVFEKDGTFSRVWTASGCKMLPLTIRSSTSPLVLSSTYTTRKAPPYGSFSRIACWTARRTSRSTAWTSISRIRPW